MKFSLTTLFFCGLILLFSTCKKMPNDGIPFYLRMDSVILTTDPTTQGANTHNITDVWVEAGSGNLGAYGLPCNFPVLQENNVHFVVSAGIKESGQSGVRIIYPFYATDTFTLSANREGRYSHRPSFRYKAGTQFPFLEDFDFGNKFNSNLSICIDSNALQNRSGKITATIDSAVTAAQTNSMTLPAGQEIWLELDYKCEIPFYIGFFANYGTGVVRTPVLFVTEKPYWNKVYVKFSNFVGASQANSYNLYFEALRPSGSAGGSVYIDNVKLVHF